MKTNKTQKQITKKKTKKTNAKTQSNIEETKKHKN